MTDERVVVTDYGVGNLFSVRRALEYCGARNVVVSSNPEDIAIADRLIIPGVGAFSDGVEGLRHLGLIEPIREHAQNNKPLLGICLGMQLLATTSREFGSHQGLNLIPGEVVPISPEYPEGVRRKVPFVGWAELRRSESSEPSNILMSDMEKACWVYLVHSFHFSSTDVADLRATYDYQGQAITAAVQRDNIYGFQFHPEKSGAVGLNLLSAFLRV